MSQLVEVIDSGWLRVAAYAAVAAIAITWGMRERHAHIDHRVDWWPTYWFVSAALLLTIGLARATDITGLVAQFGREQARSEGWYHKRRTLQALAVAAVTTAWFVGILMAIWRIPPRRRRYLRHVIALTTVVGFAAVRIISLHHIDSLLYRTEIGGVRIVSIVELALLAITALAASTARFDRSESFETATGITPRDPVESQVARLRPHAGPIEATSTSD